MYEQKKNHRKSTSSAKRSANIPDERISSVSDSNSGGSGSISSGNNKHHDEDSLAQSDVMRPLLSSNPSSSSRANSPSRGDEGNEGPINDTNNNNNSTNNAATNEGEVVGDLRPNFSVENNFTPSPEAAEGFGDDPNFDIRKYFAHKASLSSDSTTSTSSAKNSPSLEIVVKGKGAKYYVADDSVGDKNGNANENENKSLLAAAATTTTTTKLKKEGDVTCGDVFGDVMDTARQVLQQKIGSVLVGGSSGEAAVSYTTAPFPAASSSLTAAAAPTTGTSSSSPIVASPPAPARNLSSRATSRVNSQFHSRQPSGLTPHPHHNDNDNNVGTYTRAHIGNINNNDNTATTADASLGSAPPSAFANDDSDTLSPHRSLSKKSNNNGVTHGGSGSGDQQQVLMASSSSRTTSSLQRRDNEEDRRGAGEEDGEEEENEECESSSSSSAPPPQEGIPLAVSAARTLDMNLRRVKKARLLCVSNLFILGLCLGLQGYAWIAFYQKTICDVYLKDEVTFSVSSEIQSLRNAIQNYDASPITSGDWLPAEFSISPTSSFTSASSSSSHHRYYLSSNGSRQGFEAQQNGTTDIASQVTRGEARISSSWHNVTLRNIDRSRGSGADKHEEGEEREDIVIPVAEFTSFVLEAMIPYTDLEESSAASGASASSNAVTFSFTFPQSQQASSTYLLKNFTRTLALPSLNASSLSQKVVVAGWCLPLSESTTTQQAHNSCNKTIMDTYCAREYGSYAIWEQKNTVQVLLADSPPPSLSFSAAADQTDDCPLYSACGECHYVRYLTNYSVVVGPTTTAAATGGDENTYASDPTLASPLFPFNNRNLPAIPINPQEDVSAVFITPSTTPTHSNVNNEDANRGDRDDTRSSGDEPLQTLLFTPRPRPEHITIRVHLKSDPFVALERLTQGSNQFVSYVPSERFLATLQSNTAQSQQLLLSSSLQSAEASVIGVAATSDRPKQKQQKRASFVPAANNNSSGLNINAPLPDLPELSFRLLNKKYPPIGCGVPELICAWGVFLFMFAYLIVLCKKYPNYGIEADVDHDGIRVAYEDYDCEKEEGEREKGGGPNGPDDVESDYDREERLASSGDALRIATIDAQHTRTNSCSISTRDRHVEEERVGKSELANRPSVSRSTSHVNRNAKSRHQQVMENFNNSENLGEGTTFSPLTGGNPNYNATAPVRGKPNNNNTTNHFELSPRGE